MTSTKGSGTFYAPLYGLDGCIEIVQVLQESGGALARDALADQLNTTSSSSRFQSKLASGRNFGLLIYDQDIVRISDLGKRIASPITSNESSEAICKAFDNISAYKELIRRYSTTRTPNKELIANFFERECGSSPTSKKKAASAYLKSLELYLQNSSYSESLEESGSAGERILSENSVPYQSSPQANYVQYFRLGQIIGQMREMMKSSELPQSVLEALFKTLLEIPELASLEPTVKQHAELASEMKRFDILMPDVELIQRLIEGEKDE
ncbi:MAG: hypothetical protein ACE5OZ_04120 [Candidatus Heimdallarchaeota archaeon]